jgi:hypothetical protein
MIEQAVKNRWLTDDLKADAIAAIRRGLTSGDDRAEQSAVRSLVAMEAQNQKDQHKVVDVNLATRHDQLSGIAADLGIEIGVISNAESESGGSLASVAEPGVEVVRSNGAGHGRDSEAESPQ